MFDNILVVCTGNICRSPLAAAALRARHVRPGVVIGSAGTSALIGAPADPLAVDVARDAGLDLEPHRGRQADLGLLKGSDLILVMTREHSAWVHSRLPALRGRVHLLGRWRDTEIADPYGQSREVFSEIYDQIDACVGDWLARL